MPTAGPNVEPSACARCRSRAATAVSTPLYEARTAGPSAFVAMLPAPMKPQRTGSGVLAGSVTTCLRVGAGEMPAHIIAATRTVTGPGTREGSLNDYQRLWLGFSVSTIGDGVTLTAGPLLVASLTHDPLLVAGALFAQQLPWLLFSLVSGVYVDRLDRRRLIAFIDLGRAVIIGVLAVSIALGGANIDALYIALFLLGTGETLARTATQALVPSVVAPDKLGTRQRPADGFLGRGRRPLCAAARGVPVRLGRSVALRLRLGHLRRRRPARALLAYAPQASTLSGPACRSQYGPTLPRGCVSCGASRCCAPSPSASA